MYHCLIMARFCLFGDSYVERLRRYSNNALPIPGEVHFIGRGGLRTNRLDESMLLRMKLLKAETVFVNIGGNDISPSSSPREIFNRICSLVDDIRS